MKRRIFVLGLIGFIGLVVASGVYWASNLPRMNVVGKEITILNCEPPLPKYAKGVCPKLYCKKAVMESGLFPENADIGFAKSKSKNDDFKNVFGAVRYQDNNAASVIRQFQCVMEGYKVVQLLQPE